MNNPEENRVTKVLPSMDDFAKLSFEDQAITVLSGYKEFYDKYMQGPDGVWAARTDIRSDFMKTIITALEKCIKMQESTEYVDIIPGVGDRVCILTYESRHVGECGTILSRDYITDSYLVRIDDDKTFVSEAIRREHLALLPTQHRVN